MCCPSREIRGIVVFLRGRFARCPAVFPALGERHESSPVASQVCCSQWTHSRHHSAPYVSYTRAPKPGAPKPGLPEPGVPEPGLPQPSAPKQEWRRGPGGGALEAPALYRTGSVVKNNNNNNNHASAQPPEAHRSAVRWIGSSPVAPG
ncbi:hypothetical protein EYF80_052690 [Liparis tanakae]|uniref:Uncharacterized protein n=1 Tax=Liparis tanakae TaxID=230148 RepID=A0A4Z2F7B7_9TELE|nr:hypothetical protein EYF80_052690 [Liparis tanakae]